uniref:Putative secreted protein n=1 Tax=Anopheles marajoara TaxID=58244 RepID=A0A2M4C8V4_9DIPT
MLSWTKVRVAAMQHCPWFSNTAAYAILAASSTLASSQITSGLLPPSSSDTFFRLLVAAAAMMILPTSTDPVNATLRMSGCELIAPPAVGPYPGTILITPSGKPASFESAAI